MKISFRQGIVSHQQGAFLQLSNNIVSILADNRAVTVSLAHKNTNYIHSEDLSVNGAWVGPFTANDYWLYWDFNLLTFERTFAYTTLEPIAQSAKPGSGNAPIISAIPGAAGIGYFVVGEYYNLPIGRTFAVINSATNNGNYTVTSVSYDQFTGNTTIGVAQAVPTASSDGEATLDIDSAGVPLLVDGRHWFDTATNIHYVLQSNVWVPVLRVFAARVLNGVTLLSVSDNSQQGIYTGTQIGNNSSVFAGRLLFDGAGKPIVRDDKTFFTTEDEFFTNQSRVDAIRLESNVSKAQCVGSPLNEFSIVSWTSDGKIVAAQYDDVGNTVVGILTESLLPTEIGGVIIQGVITNPLWNWTTGTAAVPVGSALWASNGQLVSSDPYIADPINNPVQYVPVARVLDKDVVVFEQGLGGVGPRGPAGSIPGFPPADTSILGGVTLTSPSSDPLRAYVISDNDSRLTNARAPLAHTHQASDVSFLPGGGLLSNNTQNALVELGTDKLSLTGGTLTGVLTLNSAPTANLHAATKSYVDGLVNGLVWLESVDIVNMISDSLITPPASPNHGDSYIVLSNAPTGAWSTYSYGDISQWDSFGSPPQWNNLGQVSTFHPLTPPRFGIAMQSSTVPSGTFANNKNNIAVYYTTGVFDRIEAVVKNNAVYIDDYSPLFAYDQYVFDGTLWVRFGGASGSTKGDGLTTDVSGTVVSVIPTTSGGQVDALTISGSDLTALDLRWASLTHTHPSSAVLRSVYLGSGLWGTPVNATDGQLLAGNADAAFNSITDQKASKSPLYNTFTDLPVFSTSKGMLATVDDVDTVYFAGDADWVALADADHTHNTPYDMAFHVGGALTASTYVANFAVPRTIKVDTNAVGSVASARVPATTTSTTIIIQHDTTPYGTPIQVGTVVFAPGAYVGTITWTQSVVLLAGDMLLLTTDAAPTDVEDLGITIVGCTTYPTCTPPIGSPPA